MLPLFPDVFSSLNGKTELTGLEGKYEYCFLLHSNLGEENESFLWGDREPGSKMVMEVSLRLKCIQKDGPGANFSNDCEP